MTPLRRMQLRVALACTWIAACGGHVSVSPDAGYVPWPEVLDPPVDSVDLLVMVDNSNSMRDNQATLVTQFGSFLQTLTNPPCTNPANTTPHACDATNVNDVPITPPLHNLHVGVVSSDLGTPGSPVPGCVDTDHGDDGVLNPIRNGPADRQHPWATMTFQPVGVRPTDCEDPNEFPSFIEFESGVVDPGCASPACSQDPARFSHDFVCNADLYIGGCGLESQLEAVYRALLVHNPSDAAGNTDPNAGFLREDAILAILELTDEEDGSVRDCRHAQGQPCVDALDVYNATSTAWSSMNLNLRFYLYQPGGPQDPTWPLDRYVDPGNPAGGLLGLKPGHPERVIFAAITGVPLPGDGEGTNWRNADGSTNWDMLLGTPTADPSDFAHRDSTQAIHATSAEGPVSMQQANPDPSCPDRTVPACRREGSTLAPGACTVDQQYFAWPSRRIVEVARRFDEAPLCDGSPCHNGIVASICSRDFTSVLDELATRIQSRLTNRCLPHPLATITAPDHNFVLPCVVQEELAAGAPDACDASHGRFDPPEGPTYVSAPDGRHRVCRITQIELDAATLRPAGNQSTAHGWFYDTESAAPACRQTITFTAGDWPAPESSSVLECVPSEWSIDGGM